jgi:phosphate transport system protein
MLIRGNYEHSIADLQRRLVALGDLVDTAIIKSLWALRDHDVAAARRVIANDTAIDEQRYELEEQALRLIARQQPLAGDLRAISSWMGLASELERIGDYAEGIAAVTVRIAELPVLELSPLFSQMANEARAMLKDAIQAIVDRDATAAERLERADDHVDALYEQVLRQLLAIMRDQPELSETATYLLWAAHNLERIADRTINIAERAAFIATGTIAPTRPAMASDDPSYPGATC